MRVAVCGWQNPRVHEETVQLGSPPRCLEGRLAAPPGAVAGAVVCHPHPQYGGDMDNPVVTAVADALAGRGLAALRFNFRGVGRSQGTYDGGRGEVDDARAALAALVARLPERAPIALVGYSFGAAVALRAAADGVATRVVAIAPPLALLEPDALAALARPLTVVVGDRDQFCPIDRLAALGLTLRRVAGADHFLAGREREVAGAVLDAVA